MTPRDWALEVICVGWESRESRLRRYYRDRDILLARRRKYVEENPILVVIANLKQRAKAKNLECTITKEDIVIPERCPVLGFKLKFNKGRQQFDSPSIDRIDNNKGYTKENICIISSRANTLKGDGTLDEFEKIVKYMKERLKQ